MQTIKPFQVIVPFLHLLKTSGNQGVQKEKIRQKIIKMIQISPGGIANIRTQPFHWLRVIQQNITISNITKSNKTTALFLRKIGNTQIDKHPDKQIDG